MNTTLRRDADEIIRSGIQAVLPDKAVCRALENFQPGGGRVLLVAAGKAAWQMAHAAVQVLGRVDGGVVVTKYGHVKGGISGVNCYEAGHPVPDANSFAATEKALALAAAPALAGQNAAVFSVGSDGTDGPTDAAGGYADGDTAAALAAAGRNVFDTLQNNDAYHALQAVEGLIITGATGTNVNDVAVVLIGGEEQADA